MESQELELEAPQVHTPPIEACEPESAYIDAIEAQERRELREQEAQVHETEAHETELKAAEALATRREGGSRGARGRRARHRRAGEREFRRRRRDAACGHPRADAARVCARRL